MSNKKRYRIRKARNGEQVNVVNPMQQFMQKAAQGMQQPSPEQMAMMQQEQMLQQQSASQSENQVVQVIAQGMQQGVAPQEIIAKLLQGGVSPNEAAEGLLQVVVLKAQESGKQLSSEEGQALQAQVQEIVGSVMQQMQGAQQQEQPSEEEMIAMQEQEQMAQAPQMTKGGFKKQLLDEAGEGREMQTETPGSILPQPSTLNKFIEGVKNEGNEFYAKEMTNAADSAGMFKKGGDTSLWSDRKYARKASKQDPYARRDRRALRRGLQQGAFGRDDIDNSFVTGDSLLPENYSNRDFRDVYKDLGTMGADFASTFMPQVFSHRNTDNEFSRNGTGLEDTDVDIHFKRKPFGRREWNISGLDYTSLPAYGGRGNYNADGTYAPYGTRTQTTYSKGVEGVRTIANAINDVNDDTDDTDDTVIERDANISGPVDPVMNYQNDPEGMFSDPFNDPLRQFTDPADPALSEAAQAEAQARAEAEAEAEKARLYEQQMLEKEAQGVIDNPSDGSGMSLAEQIEYAAKQAQARGEKSLQLTPTFTDEEMPEENEKIVEEYQAKQKEAASSNSNSNWLKQGEKLGFDNIDNAPPIEVERELNRYIAKGKEWQDFISDREKVEDYFFTGEKNKLTSEDLQWLKSYPGWKNSYNNWKKARSEKDEYGYSDLDRRYNQMLQPTSFFLRNVTGPNSKGEVHKSYKDVIDEIKNDYLKKEPLEGYDIVEGNFYARLLVERYKNASAAEKAELEKKFKKAKELPSKNKAKSKAKSDAARKKAYTVDSAKKYFTDRFPDYKKNPRKYKITKVGEGIYNLDGIDGGSFMRYEPRDTYRTGGAVLPRYNAGGGLIKSAASGVNKYLPGLVSYAKSLPLHRLNPFAQSTLGPDYAVGTANSALNFFRNGTGSGAVPTSIKAYNNKQGEGWVPGWDDIYEPGNKAIQYYDDAEKYIQENSPMYNTFTNADESNSLFRGIENANPQKINQKFPMAISLDPLNKEVTRAKNLGLPYPQAPEDYRFKTFDNWKGWVDMDPKQVTKMMNEAQNASPFRIENDMVSQGLLSNALGDIKLGSSKGIMNYELENMNNSPNLVEGLINRPVDSAGDLETGYGTILNNPMYREIKGKEGPMFGITNEGLSQPELDLFLRSQMLEGIDPQSTIAFDNSAALDNQRYVEALKNQGNPANVIRDEKGKPILDPDEMQRLLFGNISGRSKLGPHGNLQNEYYPIKNRFKPNNLWTNLNRDGGAVDPKLYDYVYGGEDEMGSDELKDVTGPYFAPGGAFKKPKIDPALGMETPSKEVQDYRENVYPTSKGIFGQVGDHLKGMVSPITQGQGIKGAFNTLGQAFAPTDFNWFSQNKYGKKNALGYMGVDGLPNTIVRPWDKDSLYYDNETGYNTNNAGDRAVGKYTNLDYKKKPLRKGRLTVTDSPVQTDRDGNIVEGSNMGFLDMNQGTEIPLPGNKPKIAIGGETLNKYVMAGEIDENFMEDQESSDLNLVQNKEPDFDFSNCPEGWETDPTTECYKKSMEMGTDENKYKVNKARSINAPLIDMAAEKTADFIVDASTAVNNAKKFQHGFNTDAYSDAKANQVSYDTGQGWDAITGYQSMVDSQFNEPVRVSSARPRGMNQFASRGGQYAVGGVYDLTPQQIDAIYAAGGSIEIIE